MRRLNNENDIIEFSMKVDKFITNGDHNYVEGFIEYCTVHDIDLEVAVKLISTNLRAKIETSAIELNLLKKKSAKLPL